MHALYSVPTEHGHDVDSSEPERFARSGGKLAGAIILAVLVQYAWAAFCLLQLQEPLFQFCLFDPCEPIDRPLRDSLLLWAIPVIGPQLSMVTAILLGFSPRRLETWLFFLLGVPALAVAAFIALALTFIIAVVALGS